MSAGNDALGANEQFSSTFTQGDLPAFPARKLAILTCMDARLDAHQFLGLGLGDAHVIRNAGGRASDDAIRSLIISSRLLGTDEYFVIHHTDCGMLGFSNEDLHAALAEETGADASGIDFLPFSDLEQSVRDDIETIEASPFIPEDVSVRGFVYDVKTGGLKPVDYVPQR